MRKICILDVLLDDITMDQALQKAMSLVEDEGYHYVVTPNAEIMECCYSEKEVKKAVCHADLVLPDGAGVLKAGEMLHTPFQMQVAGVDFGQKLLPLLTDHGKSIYLLGGLPGVAERAANRIHEMYPTLRVVGFHHGFFRDNHVMVQEIHTLQPDVIFVCLGAPKQELWMANYGQETGTHLACGLGGTIDVLAGDVKRAPKWMISCRLEWLYRLTKRPHRFFRVMKNLVMFMVHVISWKGKKRV